MKVEKYLFLLLGISFFCQQSPMAKMNKPEKVHRYIYVVKDQDWYRQQALLWQSEVVQTPQDADAWYNYFMAVRYSNWQGDTVEYKNKTEAILADMGNNIPDSYEYNYLKYYNGTRNLALLEKAYKVDPDRPDALYEFILHFEKSGDRDKLMRYCNELFQTRDIAPGLLDYNYNVLASTEENTILFTNGDNDSYPCWVMQQALGIRTDVSVLNLHLCFADRSYLAAKLSEKGINLDVSSYSTQSMSRFLKSLLQDIDKNYPDIPVYTAMTIYKEFVSLIVEDLYMVGLAFKYSSERFDNWIQLNTTIQQNLRLDYLEHDWYGEDYLVRNILDKLHVNYVVLFLKLAEGFHGTGNETAAIHWKMKAKKLAEKAENKEFIEHISTLDW